MKEMWKKNDQKEKELTLKTIEGLTKCKRKLICLYLLQTKECHYSLQEDFTL